MNFAQKIVSFCISFFLFIGAVWAEPVRSVLIVGDKSDEIPQLRKFLEVDGWKVTQSAQKELDAKAIKDYPAVVVYIHEVILEPIESALIEYAENGGRLLVVHHALASAKMKNPRWLKFLGIMISPRNAPKAPWFVSGDTSFDIINLTPAHFITSNKITYPKRVVYRDRELPAFRLNDSEIFHNQCFTDGEAKTKLLAFRLDDDVAAKLPSNVSACEETAGWMKPTGKGWTIYFQPGHAATDFENPIFAQLILNSLQWTPEKKSTE